MAKSLIDRTKAYVGMATTGGGRSRARRVALLVAIPAALFVTLMAILTTRALTAGIKASLDAHLSTLLESDVVALEVWIQSHRYNVAAWAGSPHVSRYTARLLELAGEADDVNTAIVGSAPLRDLRDAMPSVDAVEQFSRYIVASESGVIIGSSDDDFIGRRASPEGQGVVARAFEGEILLTPPSWAGTMVLNPPRTPRRQPMMLAAAPVRNAEGRPIAVLVYRIDPARGFTRILSTARAGETGETYAFDEQGLMLSESRFVESLREGGLLPEDAGESTALQVQVRDPGGDITRGFRLSTPIGSRPLTRMAASAVSGETGIDTDGYRDYRGVEVVGAWTWLDDFGFGVATELDMDEAMQPLMPARIADIVTLVIIGLGAAAFVGGSYLVNRLRSRIENVQRLGQYALERKIGEGGMGSVYRARHAMLRRPTAIKLLKPDAMGEDAIQRFETEVQLTAQLTHPNTIAVYDYGRTDAGIFYYAMELLEGLTLAKLLAIEGAVPAPRAVHILRQVCGSLAEAHGVGLVHRDIKPLNIILCERGGQKDVVKVLDFGLVRDTRSLDARVTHEQVVSGTPGYIAPERLRDPMVARPQVDVYAVGCVAFNLLTGEQVFTGSSAMELVAKAVHEAPPLPSDRVDQIPAALDELVHACIATDPDRRPADAAVLLARLEELDIEPWSQHDARAWWAEHDAEIAGTRGPHASPSDVDPTDMTMPVNLRGRGLNADSSRS